MKCKKKKNSLCFSILLLQQKYYNIDIQNGIKQTGNCEYNIPILYIENKNDPSIYQRTNQGFWHVEAWYGLLVVRKVYHVAGKYEVSKLNKNLINEKIALYV